jgi:hypothetical protein
MINLGCSERMMWDKMLITTLNMTRRKSQYRARDESWIEIVSGTLDGTLGETWDGDVIFAD